MPYQQPSRSDVYVNAPLGRLSVAMVQKITNFGADRAFPVVPVDVPSAVYFVYPRGDFNRDEMQQRAPGTESAGSGWKVTTGGPYYTPVYAFHKDISDQLRDAASSSFNLEREATLFVTMKDLIKREKSFVTNFFGGGIWTGGDVDGVSGVPGAGQFKQWNDAASRPIEDIRLGKTVVLEKTGFEPNVLVIGRRVWDALVDHPDLIGRVDRGQTQGPALVLRETMAALFELDEIIVMNSIENSAHENATEVSAFIGGKKALLLYRPPAPGLMTPSAGYTFAWNGRTGASDRGTRITKFRLEHLKSDRIEIESAFAQHLVAAELGYFFDTAVA